MKESKLKQWPFIEANKILKRFEKSSKTECVFQTGYGPSGLPHIGTFGEIENNHGHKGISTHFKNSNKVICFF